MIAASIQKKISFKHLNNRQALKKTLVATAQAMIDEKEETA